MDSFLESKTLLPGFRFHPTDEELLLYHLKKKLMGKSVRQQVIGEVEVYKFAPWDLPKLSFLKTRDLNWYFLCPQAKKYGYGSKANRANDFGYWKSTGNDRTVVYRERPVGKIKTLIFHQGKAPNGKRTDWVIHEYKMVDQILAVKGFSLDSYVLCKIYQKSGLGPRNGEQYGAPFVEEDWEDSDMATGEGIPQQPSSSVLMPNATSPTGEVDMVCTPTTIEQTNPVPPLMETGDELDRLLATFSADDFPPIEAPVNQTVAPLDDGFFDGLEDLEDVSNYSSSTLNSLSIADVVGNAGLYIQERQYIEMDDLFG